MEIFSYSVHGRNHNYRDSYSSFTVGFYFPMVSLEASKLQSHDLENTGTDAVNRIYSTKGPKTEQPEGRPRSPVLQGDPLFSQKEKEVWRPARAQCVFKRSALFEILVQPGV